MTMVPSTIYTAPPTQQDVDQGVGAMAWSCLRKASISALARANCALRSTSPPPPLAARQHSLMMDGDECYEDSLLLTTHEDCPSPVGVMDFFNEEYLQSSSSSRILYREREKKKEI